MRVSDIMSRPVITTPYDSSAETAAQLMWDFDCGIIPVVDDQGRITGVITDRDICMAAYTQGKPLAAIPVASAMSKAVAACGIDELVEHVELLMRANKVRRIPVVDADNRPIGIVAMNDIARVAAHARRGGVDRQLVETLGAVCQPRGVLAIAANNVAAA